MERRYEIGRKVDLREIHKKSSFFARVYKVSNESVLADCEDNSLEGLAAKVRQKIPSITLEGEEVKSISTKSALDGIGRFSVSDEEIIKFYNFLGKFGEANY